MGLDGKLAVPYFSFASTVEVMEDQMSKVRLTLVEESSNDWLTRIFGTRQRPNSAV